MSNIKNEPTIQDEEIVALRNAFGQRARWMKLLIDQLKKDGGDWEAKAREAIRTYGVENGERFKGQMCCPCVGELPKFVGAKWARKIFEIDVVEESDEVYEMHFHHCPLITGWEMEGCSEEEIRCLCDIAMDGDRGMADGVGVDFYLGKKIAEGHDYCELRFTPKK